MTGPLNLPPATARGLETDRDSLVTDLARQPPDDVVVHAIEGVRDAKHSGQPLYEQTPVWIERREPPVAGGIRQRLSVIAGYECTYQSILLVKTGNIELQDQVAADLVVFPRHNV